MPTAAAISMVGLGTDSARLEVLVERVGRLELPRRVDLLTGARDADGCYDLPALRALEVEEHAPSSWSPSERGAPSS